MRWRRLSLTVLLPAALIIGYVGVYVFAFPVYQAIPLTKDGKPYSAPALTAPKRIVRSRLLHRIWLPAAWVEEAVRSEPFGFWYWDDEVDALGLEPKTKSMW